MKSCPWLLVHVTASMETTSLKPLGMLRWLGRASRGLCLSWHAGQCVSRMPSMASCGQPCSFRTFPNTVESGCPKLLCIRVNEFGSMLKPFGRLRICYHIRVIGLLFGVHGCGHVVSLWRAIVWCPLCYRRNRYWSFVHPRAIALALGRSIRLFAS